MIVRTTDIGGIQVLETDIPDFPTCGDYNPLESDIRRAVTGITSDKRRREIVATRRLVKHRFGREAVLQHLPSGKPIVTVGGSPVSTHISLSHCKDRAVLAASGRCAIGIDVECIADRVLRIADRVLCREEMRRVGSSPLLATVAWTAKEALFKCIPEDGVDFRERLNLDLSGLTEDFQSAEFTAEAYGRSYLLTCTVDRPFVTTLARPKD